MKETHRKKIVVVDDDEFIRKTFFLIFNRDYDVYLAADGTEALARFLHAPVDLIITDLRLPKLNGLEMISRFRAAGFSGEVVLITAFPDRVDDGELRKLRIGRFFAKPLDLDALTESVRHILQSNHIDGKSVLSL